MQIPFSQFEQHIDETILDRGLTYFKNGHITSVEELYPGEFEAVVEGTEDYEVRLKIQNNTVTEYSCTCPYDYGSVCKHIVAVLYYLQQEEAGSKDSDKGKKSTRKPATKRKTVSEQVDELLASLSHNDLKKFIKEQSLSDAMFRRSFLTFFAHKSSRESPEIYREQVKNILKSAKGRETFIEWPRVGKVGKAVNALLDMAMRHVDSGNFMSAIFICLPVVEEMVKALDYTDDSNGDIGSNIETAFEILGEIASEEIPEDVRLYLLDQCKHLVSNNIFSGWDWQTYLLDIAVQLVKTEKEAENVLSLLHTHVHSEYESEQMTKLEYELIRKMSGETEAEAFINMNLDNPELRRKAIDTAIKNKDFEKAVSLARDGIKRDSNDKPGLAKEWYDWLLRIALAQKDKSRIIEYAHYLFVDGFRQDQDYYAILKQNIETAEWTGYVEGLIDEIKRKDRWPNFGVIGKILVTEQLWERLLKLVSETRHLAYIQHYEQYLSGMYPTEPAELYENGILDLLKNKTGRSHYKEACRYMRRMIKLGAQERVIDLIETLRKEFPQRTALLDELNKL